MSRHTTVAFSLGFFASAALAQNFNACHYDDPAYPDWANPCQGWGVDFQDKGSYFQNASSKDNFSFVSIFEGCETGIVNNILYNDETTDEWFCTDTSTNPDDSTQLSTCPIQKNKLTSGNWTLGIISNNGDGCPIAYQREIYLSVGTPATVTYTPTITLPITVTPIYNYTITTTSTDVETTTTVVTSPSKTIKPTTTLTPKPVTTTRTDTIGTIKKTKYTAIPTIFTKTVIKTCSLPRKQDHPDPTMTFTPTLISAAALATGEAVVRRNVWQRAPVGADGKIVFNRNAKKQRRGLDVPTVTITDTNTADFSTTTSTSYAPTSTMTITTQAIVTSWSTATSTTYTGVTKLSQVTVTAPTRTKTKLKFTVVTQTVATITKTPTVTITVHTAPPQSTKVCTAKGGKMVG